MKMSGTNIKHIPYKGAAPAYTDLMNGQVQLLCSNIISSIPMVKARSN